jgi:class 3 adenylate cyclase/tetratricopeptide (TPR) repeat protein
MKCPKCQSENPEGKKYCGDCGHRLDEPILTATPIPSTDSERKHVTVLFSDMSGYTAMTEKLDPEEVKEIMGRVFGEISQVVARYQGFIEKFIGDAVMALFGATVSHEDDPVRAIKAAREIHDIVFTISPRYEKKIGRPLTMHTGICTGLVVTGDVNLEKGTHGVLGDTINTASRLSGLAKPGEIVISSETHRQAEGYFTFEPLEVTHVKGKAEVVKPYKVISQKEDPNKTHGLSGLRAALIGRKVEMAQLQEALQSLKQGKGSIFSIVGDAGTGKSRLIEEFKSTVNPDENQWREGHAYAYSQNIPYFPVMDLLRRAWQVHEGDSIEQIRQKVETGARSRLGEREYLLPFVGSLFSLKYPEIEYASPELWKARLHEAIRLILEDLCKRVPAIICIEDLHWADPSSVELIKNTLAYFRHPIMFLFIYRPTFRLFASHELSTLTLHQEIRLHDLSPSESQDMVESMLKTKEVPTELSKFVSENAEGNPFYLEETINTLIETASLIHENGQWVLTKPVTEIIIPSTVQGVISAKIDRLGRGTKRILQEASVIGRSFLYEILKHITDLKEHIDKSLTGLERLDLIRTISTQPDLEYIFKHALIQEVVYNAILKKDRRSIHERIGTVIEAIYHDRLPDFYDTLAFHFKQGQSLHKAVDYLMKAGEKSLNRYALDEAHQYYREAYEILTREFDKSEKSDEILIGLLVKWAVVYNCYGRYRELVELFIHHEDTAASLMAKEDAGMYFAWFGYAYQRRELVQDAFKHLQKAIHIGEESHNQKVIGYAGAWLVETYADLCRLNDALQLAERVEKIARSLQSDRALFRFALVGSGYANLFKGNCKKEEEIGNAFLEYGRGRSDPACIALAYKYLGIWRMSAGDFPSAIDFFKKSIDISVEPHIIITSQLLLVNTYLAANRPLEAETVAKEIAEFDEKYGFEFAGTVNKAFQGIILISKGEIDKGIGIVEDVANVLLNNKSFYRYAQISNTVGKIYLQIAQKLKIESSNANTEKAKFLIKKASASIDKAEDYFHKALDAATELGAKIVQGQANVGLAMLYGRRKKNDQAKKHITDAIHLYEECEADVFLKQAREALAAME